jgi:hypothetical protein
MPLITCKEVSVLASQQHERKLTPWERFTLGIHLFVCDGCRRVVRQIAIIRQAVKQLAERDDAPR